MWDVDGMLTPGGGLMSVKGVLPLGTLINISSFKKPYCKYRLQDKQIKRDRKLLELSAVANVLLVIKMCSRYGKCVYRIYKCYSGLYNMCRPTMKSDFVKPKPKTIKYHMPMPNFQPVSIGIGRNN